VGFFFTNYTMMHRSTNIMLSYYSHASLHSVSSIKTLLARCTYLAGDNPVTVATTGNQDMTHTRSVTQGHYFIWKLL